MTVAIGQAKGASANGWHRISSYLECAKKYQYAEVRKIGVHMDQTPSPFAIGLLFHALRARWFANNFSTAPENWQSLLEAVDQARLDAPAPFAEEDIRKALDLFQAYMEHYVKLPLAQPVACEHLLEGTVAFAGPDFSARIDDVSRYPEAGGQLCIGEAKTTSDIAGTLNEYTLHGQPMLQAALWEVSPEGAKKHGSIAGVMLDIARKPYGKVGPKFLRQFMPINRYVLDWYAENVSFQKSAALATGWHDEPPRNITSCTRMYGRMRVECPYRPLCMYGKTAAGNYVIGSEKTPLNEWTPQYEGQEEPWK